MEAHGYPLKSNVVNQHNQSANIMETSGQASCNRNSLHIHFRYFFVEDGKYKGEFSIDYCPAWKVLADYFQNSLQGKIFNVFKEVIVRWKHVSEIENMLPPSSKGCVGKWMESKNGIFSFF